MSAAIKTRSNSKEKARTMVTKTSHSIRDRQNEDEFMAAAIGDSEWLKQSLKHSKTVNFDKNGLAALHLASLHGRLDCVKLLIDKNKHDVNLPSSTGWRPIHLAISNQTGKRAFAVVEYLLSKGADFTVTNDDGITPMHQAASEGHIQCLKALIENGAKIYVKDHRGHTPLDLAKLWGHRQCARILATEQWHQEKDEVAKELKRIKKTRMISELNNLALLEDERAGKQFYGAQAYQDWLGSKGLEVDQKTGRIKSADKSDNKQQPKISGLHNPPTIAESKMKRGGEFYDRDYYPLSPVSSGHDTLEEGHKFYQILEPRKVQASRQNEIRRLQTREKIHAKKFFNENDWNPTPQCDLLGHYQKDLQDCYPRDPVTKLPHQHAAPKYLAGHKNVPISAFSHPDAYKSERKVVFQPENILDAQTKTKYSEDQTLTKPQVFLHLCSDLNSQLFRGGLYTKDKLSGNSMTIITPLESCRTASSQASKGPPMRSVSQISSAFH